MHTITAGLIAFGFTEKEARAYLAGCELGATTVLALARRTRLPRTTLYPILEKLRRGGYFKLSKVRGHSLYVAESPALLAEKFHARERIFTHIVPDLESRKGTVREGAGVTIFEGTEGFKQLWQKIFRSGVKEYRILTPGSSLLEFVKEKYIVRRLIAERIRRGIKSMQLIVDSPAARTIIAKDARELRESRIIPAHTALPATIIIFGNEVAFITTRRENVMILVASGELATTHHTLFDLLWSRSALS